MSRIWTPKELEQLKELYPNTDVKVIAKVINRPIGGIYRKASKLGINRSDEWKNKMQLLFSETLKRVGVNTRLKKGSVPPNKGKRMKDFLTPEQYEKVRSTQFKKGNVLVNIKSIGYERITADGYIEVKVKDCKNNSYKNFELKHRLVWQQHNGPIPEGMIIEFIDGDSKNITIGNLRLASRKENMIRNSEKDVSIVKRFLKIKNDNQVDEVINEFPELIESIRLKNKLNKKLNEYGRNN